jgi:DNA polymerase
MYNLPYDILIKDKEKRQVAKPAVLGCGYGLGPGVKGLDKDGNECRDPRLIVSYRIIWQCDECMGKFTADEDGTCPHVCQDESGNQLGDLKLTGLLGYADNMGVTLTPEQAWTSHRAFQTAYKEVPILWQNIERAVVRVLRTGKSEKLHFVEFSRVSLRNGQYVLVCKLPSGRCLHYMNARLESEEKVSQAGKPYTKYSIYYDGIGHGVGATTKKQGWAKVYTYGGKLVENIVQAIARDILAHAMWLAHMLGMFIVGHVHDEIICEEEIGWGSFGLSDLKQCMEETPDWAPGLPLGAEGYEGPVYKKG